jgi:hypothetical protein
MIQSIAPFVVKFKSATQLELERLIAELKVQPPRLRRPLWVDMPRHEVIYIYEKFGDGPPKSRAVYVTSKPKWHE